MKSVKPLRRTYSKLQLSSMANQNKNSQQEVAVVMVPFPAQGHLNQLLHLSRLIVSYNIPVHYVGSTIHVRQAKSRIQGWNPNDTENIHFQEFTVPHLPCPLPDPNSITKFPTHLHPLFESTLNLREPLAQFLSCLSYKNRRVVVIFDSMLQFVGEDVASLPNGESYSFVCCSAFSACKLMESLMNLVQGQGDISLIEDCFTDEILRFFSAQGEYKMLNSGTIYNTSRAIDGPYMDLVAERGPTEGDRKLWAVGPVNPVKTSNSKHSCLEWLDKQEPKSVIYVSFGSTTSMNDAQIKELALGLERSHQKFIWILRYADTGDIFAGEKRIPELPEGFEERVKERGVVVREWGPQLEILSHPCTGGFMSHCGWNSCMESISNGVPIAAWPMHSEQPMNTEFVTKVLNIGIVVREWEKRDELVGSTDVESSVKMLMASREGDEIRKRAEELGEAVRLSISGGASRQELDSFIAHITR